MSDVDIERLREAIDRQEMSGLDVLYPGSDLWSLLDAARFVVSMEPAQLLHDAYAVLHQLRIQFGVLPGWPDKADDIIDRIGEHLWPAE